MLDVKVKHNNGKRCWIWHSWELVGVVNYTEYTVCKDCGTRRIRQSGTGYQPVAWDWVEGATDDVGSSGEEE